MTRRLSIIRSLAAVAVVAAMTACADRGQMYSEDAPAARDTSSPQGDAHPQSGAQVRVTGCFQEMTGFNNFVLSNIGDAPGGDPAATRSYRIEQRGEFEQYVGKQVTVAGRVDAQRATRGMAAGEAASGDVDFNDLPELHVESVTVVSENCGTPR